ncbi:hypothetical protein [Actinacidiphila rubida]|uniref:Uncharacterized protein n=1 Tax=Actinacidiphila rubida TaxID=310780 RepID=A0A1H8UJU9_9ACTN|nr:hypothetical protein [Actinacidiphila rubida]SEP03243.1 hypothetical protein SAMN05216267_10758 [Actinacidiphila rubida]
MTGNLRGAVAAVVAQAGGEPVDAADAAVAGEPVDLVGRSRWPQLRLAERGADHGVLARLAEGGETRRIRRTAAERLRGLRAGGPG